MKISYIITTIRQPEMAAKTIKSIEALGPHDYEILVTSPNRIGHADLMHNGRTRIILDYESVGSVASNNATIHWAQGEWLAFLPDDFKLQNLDINAFQAFLDGPEMQKKTFKMFSYHTYSAHKITGEYQTPIPEPYQVLHFPIVARETIDNKLDGVIFNHRFGHHYCDHYLGWYASKHEQYEPLNYSLFHWPNAPQLINLHSPGGNQTNSSFTSGDEQILAQLYQEHKLNPNLGYNI